MKTGRLGIPLFVLIVLGVVLVFSIQVKQDTLVDFEEEEVSVEYVAPELLLREDKTVYDRDDDGSVDIFEVTVLPPEGIYKTMAYINENVNYESGEYTNDDSDPQAQVILKVEGQEYYGTLELRGQSSRLEDQKSYKIKLFDDQGTFNGLQVLNLNKHYKDILRIRNKLAYDLIEDIDGLIGLRTRFVRLYIWENGVKEDYGLFTLVEQPNKAFLDSHGLDADGQLYKAEFFEFLRYKGILEDPSSPTYSEDNFNRLLEVRENPDHDKLVALLDRINNPTNNINDIVNDNFSKENMLTWIAYNTLLDNYDSNSRNYLLYSPAYSHVWYFVPWDLDKTMRKEEKAHWSFGISNYWGVELFNRFFRDPANRDALIEKVEELYLLFTPNEMRRRLDSYRPVLEEHMFGSADYYFYKDDILDSRHRHPDINTEKDFWEAYYELALMPTENRKRFYRNLERPYPFFIDYTTEDGHRFSWDLAFDMQGDAVTYTIKLAADVEMLEVLYAEETGELSVVLDEIPEGAKYWTVVAMDSKGNEQIPFNQTLQDGYIYIGVEKIEAEDDE